MTIKVAVVGATGRMGRLASELIGQAADMELVAMLDSRSDAQLGDKADVIFEATRLEVSEQVIRRAIEQQQKIVVATSGWTSEDFATLGAQIAGEAAVVIVPNFSIGSMLATEFAATAARYFNSIEIVEAHHAGKLDSPSGTAIRTAELIAAERANHGDLPVLTVAGAGQPARGVAVADIPIHSLRLAGVSAKQAVHLGGDSELLTIEHEVSSPRAYAAGILASLRYAATAKGLTVGLAQVLGR